LISKLYNDAFEFYEYLKLVFVTAIPKSSYTMDYNRVF
jgi:hypothetical protein